MNKHEIAVDTARVILQGHGTAFSVEEVTVLVEMAIDKWWQSVDMLDLYWNDGRLHRS